MTSEWRVTSNVIDGVKMYAAYRLRDADGIDHSGNREYFGGYTYSRKEAECIAASLNKEE